MSEGFAYFRWHAIRFPKTPPFPKPRPWRLRQWSELQLKSVLQANLAAYHGDIDGDFNYW